MPIALHGDPLPLTMEEATRLWEQTIKYRQFPDEQVAVACISEEEIREHNRRYRNKDAPTNVLTFSYDDEHDVVLCMSVIEQEASERNFSLQQYTALILVHAFLHVTGLDHEVSSAEAQETRAAEGAILEAAGFTPLSL